MPVIHHSLLACLALLAGADALAQLPAFGGGGDAPQGIVSGLVTDSSGSGIAGATISVIGASGIQLSESNGSFRIGGVPVGNRVVVARRIGFRPESLSVSVVADTIHTVSIRLEPVAQQVAPVIVTASSRYTGRLRGFNERRDRGIGRFFTADDIEKRRPRVVTDLLRLVPGTRIINLNGQNIVTFRGLRCAPLVWLDGSPATAGYLDVDLFTPSTLAGIEVYAGPASIPSELTWMRGRSSCGVIALWTKMPEHRARQSSRLSVTQLEAMLKASELFTADLVDTPAAPDEEHPIVPIFPDSLMRAAVGGRVVAEFVVDINGKANMATFSAVQSTHEMFTEAVRGAVSSATFTPAWLGGKRVRQLVQLPFSFAAPGKPDGS